MKFVAGVVSAGLLAVCCASAIAGEAARDEVEFGSFVLDRFVGSAELDQLKSQDPALASAAADSSLVAAIGKQRFGAQSDVIILLRTRHFYSRPVEVEACFVDHQSYVEFRNWDQAGRGVRDRFGC